MRDRWRRVAGRRVVPGLSIGVTSMRPPAMPRVMSRSSPQGSALREMRATDSYKLIHEAMAAAFHDFGVECLLQAESTSDGMGVCFVEPAKFDLVHRGQKITIRGNKFSGIARIHFLNVLQQRCLDVGVDLRFRAPISNISDLPPADLLVGADGANSLVRREQAELFGPTVEYGRNKYIWLGTPQLFHGLTLTFEHHATGLYAAHSYKFDSRTSTFIVECSEATWRRAGLDSLDEPATCEYLQGIFRHHLEGQPLLTNNFVRWLNFPLVRNARWHGDKVVLVGDALHTAHFSVGSGTKLALEDAIALARACAEESHVPRALSLFERNRRPRVEQVQHAAMESLRWFEEMDSYTHLDPLPFALSAMTRSKRIDYENLRQRDPAFVAEVEDYQRNHAGT